MFNLKFLEDSLPDFATIQTERSFQSHKKAFWNRETQISWRIFKHFSALGYGVAFRNDINNTNE